MKRIYLIALVLLLMLTGCGQKASQNVESNQEVANTMTPTDIPTNTPTLEPTETPTPTPEPEPVTYSVDLLAVGDNLYHSTVYKKGLVDGKYNFDFVYENVKDLIGSYDLSVINQETVFVTDYADVSSYPCFGTPSECGDALINAGFDVVLGATNHSYDKREKGVLSTVEYWRNHPEVTFIGMYDNEVDFKDVTIVENNNIKIAMLNYTYGLNGFVIPEDKYYYVDTLYDKEKIQRDLEYAELNADITIVFPHWGTEYVYDEVQSQKDWAMFFTEHGADIIIGSHPHVIEPVRQIVSDNGNTSICYYSLGNFVSGQDKKPRILGGIATVGIEKVMLEDEVISVEVTYNDFIPCVTHYNSSEHTIYLLSDYTDELAAKTKLQADTTYLWNLWNGINSSSYINKKAE